MGDRGVELEGRVMCDCYLCAIKRDRESVCVSVCVCKREGERESV